MEIIIKLNPVITTLEDGSKIDEYELSINNGTNLYTLKNVKSYEEVESSILDFVRGQTDNINKEFTKKADSKLVYIDSLIKGLDYSDIRKLDQSLQTILEYAGKPMEGPEELAKYLADEGQTFKPDDSDIYLEEYNKFKEEQ